MGTVALGIKFPIYKLWGAHLNCRNRFARRIPFILKHSTKFKALWKYRATTLKNKIRRKWKKVESDTKVHMRK